MAHNFHNGNKNIKLLKQDGSVTQELLVVIESIL
jgi:hypothetical protein